jgi:hypothetical protein
MRVYCEMCADQDVRTLAPEGHKLCEAHELMNAQQDALREIRESPKIKKSNAPVDEHGHKMHRSRCEGCYRFTDAVLNREGHLVCSRCGHDYGHISKPDVVDE